MRLAQTFWKQGEIRGEGSGTLRQAPAQAGHTGLSQDVCACIVSGVCEYMCLVYHCIMWVVHVRLLCTSVCCVTIM